MSHIVVIGAGWAGLNCAYELTKAGHNVTLLEAAPQVGGRARGVRFGETLVDNGQHIAMGAYHTLRNLITELGLDERKLFKILPLHIKSRGGKSIDLRLANLPTPFNLMIGIWGAKNLPWRAKLQMLRLGQQFRNMRFQLATDCTIFQLLKNYHQSDFIIEHLWQPIALAAMSTAIDQASAQVFLNILREVFYGRAINSHWYLPSVDLSALLPQVLAKKLLAKGQTVITGDPVKKIELQDDRCTKITSTTGEWLADHFVLAIPPVSAANLLHIHPILDPLCKQLMSFQYETITTVYYQFAQPVELPYPMYGLQNTLCQWIFDRAFAQQPEILSAVITGAIPAHMDNASLAQHILHEIQQVFGHLEKAINFKVIREKRAAFVCDVATQKLRPGPRTAIKNLWLCGDYLQTGLPATLEGALLSGKQTCWELLGGL